MIYFLTFTYLCMDLPIKREIIVRARQLRINGKKNLKPSPCPWWICTVGSMVQDNTKNNSLYRATSYLSVNKIFIQKRVKSSLYLKKKSWCQVLIRNAVKIKAYQMPRRKK